MTVSVIIPVLNEASTIQETLKSVLKQKPCEIVVVDANSTDGTAKLVREISGIQCLESVPGRAMQMNLGAKKASGDSLLFLHADTQLPCNGLELISQELDAHQEVVGGRFRVSFDDTSWLYRAQSYYTRFPFFSYGDQAFFVRKNIFEEIDGYNENEPLEDIDFFKRLMNRGKVKIFKESVITSSRRFKESGFIRQKMINFFCSTLFHMGISPRFFMQRWYKEVR